MTFFPFGTHQTPSLVNRAKEICVIIEKTAKTHIHTHKYMNINIYIYLNMHAQSLLSLLSSLSLSLFSLSLFFLFLLAFAMSRSERVHQNLRCHLTDVPHISMAWNILPNGSLFGDAT